MALLMRVVVPVGFMPTVSNGAITIALCSGHGAVKSAIELPGLAEHRKTDHSQGHSEMPCGFGGLSAPSLAAADSVLLAVAIAYIVTTTFRGVQLRLSSWRAHLRPPLRGPPLIV